MNETAFIYALNDPETGRCRYVGKSINLRRRMKDHLQQAKRGKTHRDCWISALVERDLFPQLEILDEVPRNEWEFWEREYIRVFRALGLRLTNLTDGGDGVSTGTRLSPEHRKKLSLLKRGKKFSEEHKRNLSNSLRGQVRSEEQRQNIRAAKLITSEETRRRLRVAWEKRRPIFKLAPRDERGRLLKNLK